MQSRLHVCNPIWSNDLGSRLTALGIRYLEVERGSLPNHYTMMENIRSVHGVGPRARELVDTTQAQLRLPQNRSARLPKVKLLFVVGHRLGTLTADRITKFTGRKSFATMARASRCWADALAAARSVQCPSLVIDTEPASGVTGRSKELANAMRGRHIKLDDLGSDQELVLTLHRLH